MVIVGMVIVDSLGIVVSVRDPFSPLGTFISPGRYVCVVGVVIFAHTVMVLVPSALCGTWTVPLHIVTDDTPCDGTGIVICSLLSCTSVPFMEICVVVPMF